MLCGVGRCAQVGSQVLILRPPKGTHAEVHDKQVAVHALHINCIYIHVMVHIQRHESDSGDDSSAGKGVGAGGDAVAVCGVGDRFGCVASS